MMNIYPPSQTGPSNQDILLAEIRNMLSIVTRTLLLNPADEAAKTQATALNQLQSILQTSALPYDQVESVRQQLATLPIQQRLPPPLPPQQIATPPILEFNQQDQNTESLLQ